MSDPKVTPSQLRHSAVVYVRKSPLAQVERNRESTARQYDLVARAERLGWPRSAVRVIDDDLGVSGSNTTGRSGFAELAAQVGPGQVGIVLPLEVSRLARPALLADLPPPTHLSHVRTIPRHRWRPYYAPGARVGAESCLV